LKQFFRRHKSVGSLFKVILVEYLESCKLYRFRENEVTVCALFELRLSPSIHMHDHLYFRTKFDVLGVSYHFTCKTMYDKNLRGKVVFFYQPGKILRTVIYVGSIIGSDSGSRLCTGFHRELRIDPQMNIRKL